MDSFKIGDIVARKSHNGDISFVVTDIKTDRNGKPVYILRGLLHRILADADFDDLVKQNYRSAYRSMRTDVVSASRNVSAKSRSSQRFFFYKFRSKPGKILHIDSASEYIDMCMEHYRNAGLKAVSVHADESEQPALIRRSLERYKPDILVVTGHDGIKKDSADLNSISNYRTSKYFIESVKEARKYESGYDKLCIFAGACQSYYEGIMGAGANFASSPGRILINALDPAIVAERVALTDSRSIITPEQISELTVSGRDGIWGINTRGHLILK